MSNSGGAVQSLFIIPGAATDNYKLTAQLYDKNSTLLKVYTYDDAITTWFGIWFLPVIGYTPLSAADELWENMFKALFLDLIKDNVLFNVSRT